MQSPTDLDGALLPLAAAAAAGYLLGAVPFGYLVARSRGVDIFRVGSKSPGATNVRRVLGKGPGNLVFILDALKGALAAGLPVAFSARLAAPVGRAEAPPLVLGAGLWDVLGYAGLAMALVGHSFSCFTRFRGGKGVATAAGGLMVLMPAVALAAAGVWVFIFYASRFVSLASILAACSLPLVAYLTHRGAIGIGVAALIAAFVVIRHRANVGRLLSGTEAKFTRSRTAGAGREGAP
jgi:glycerol-3-phosphate acyltransferase PlsY